MYGLDLELHLWNESIFKIADRLLMFGTLCVCFLVSEIRQSCYFWLCSPSELIPLLIACPFPELIVLLVACSAAGLHVYSALRDDCSNLNPDSRFSQKLSKLSVCNDESLSTRALWRSRVHFFSFGLLVPS